MKKPIIALLTIITLLVPGCSSSNQADSTNNTNVTNQSVEDEQIVTPAPDDPVEIILSMYSFEDGMTIEKYIEDLQVNNPDVEYSVYDDSHYIMTVTESERKMVLSDSLKEENMDTVFDEMFSQEIYCNAFLDMDYDELFQNVTLFVDKALYEQSQTSSLGFSQLGILMFIGLYSDLIQGYSLIPIEDRTCTYQIIDNDTKEILFDSNTLSENADTSENNDTETIDKLREIRNWYVTDIWNNFVNFDAYRRTGQDCTGSEIDIDFAYDEFKKQYTKLDEYDVFMCSLDSEYDDIKNAWGKMVEQIKKIYTDLEQNGIKHDGSDLNLDLLSQYGTSFENYVYEY